MNGWIVTRRLSVGNDQRVGSGAYDRLEVSSVHRVHSAAAWMAYAASKEALRRDAAVADDLGVPPPPPHRPLTLGHLSAEMVGSLDADVGEAFLMHGTKRGAQRHIARGGFDERLSGTGSGTFYGQGVYFAENVCKADQYSMPDGDGLCRLIVARVALGTHPYACTDGNATHRSHSQGLRVAKWRLLPELSDGAGVRYTSLRGVARERAEYVVYRGAQSYPEFIVTYKRLRAGAQAKAKTRAQ